LNDSQNVFVFMAAPELFVRAVCVMPGWKLLLRRAACYADFNPAVVVDVEGGMTILL